MHDAGSVIDRVEVDPATGKISVVISKDAPQSGEQPNPWLADLQPTKKKGQVTK
jgi:hypothetical protein